MSQVLTQLLEELGSGRLRVVDLTQPLSPQTPLLPLPPPFNNTPAFKIWELSHYDERGPAWYWKGFETGEYTGTHFDALADNSVDRIPPRKSIGPACVIDISAEAARDPN
jgi:isatin hydrolase